MKKVKLPKLKFKESLKPIIDDCAYEISTEVLRQIDETEFDICFSGFGHTWLGLEGDEFGAPLPKWPKIALNSLKEEIANGCINGDGIDDYIETLKILKEYINILEKELSKRAK